MTAPEPPLLSIRPVRPCPTVTNQACDTGSAFTSWERTATELRCPGLVGRQLCSQGRPQEGSAGDVGGRREAVQCARRPEPQHRCRGAKETKRTPCCTTDPTPGTSALPRISRALPTLATGCPAQRRLVSKSSVLMAHLTATIHQQVPRKPTFCFKESTSPGTEKPRENTRRKTSLFISEKR